MSDRKSARKIRRRRQRRPRVLNGAASKPDMSLLEAKMRALIDAEHHSIDMGVDGWRFANMILNPLGQDEGGDEMGPHRVSCPMPDMVTDVNTLCITGSVSFTGATGVAGAIVFVPPNLTNGGQVDVVYGNDPETPASSPTGVTVGAFTCGAMLNSMFPGVITHGRIISAAFNVVPVSSSDHTDGYLRAYSSIYPGRTAVGTYNTYGAILDHALPGTKHYPVKDGLTVRSALNDKSFELGAITNLYVSPATWIPELPVVMFKGLSVTTVLQISYVIHMEIAGTEAEVPFVTARVPYEPEIKQLVAFANRASLVTTGHSFKSFFRAIGKGFSQAFRFVKKGIDLAPKIIGPAQQVAGAIAPFI